MKTEILFKLCMQLTTVCMNLHTYIRECLKDFDSCMIRMQFTSSKKAKYIRFFKH